MPPTDAILARLETEVEHLKKDLTEVKTDLNEMNDKLQQLLDAANMGKGAWWAAVKIGAFLTMSAGAFLWVYEKGRALLTVKI